MSFICGNLIIGCVTLLSIIVLYFKWLYSYWSKRNVPSLQPTIPFGNVKDALLSREHIHVSFAKIYEQMKIQKWKFGGIYIATKPSLVVLDLDLIRNILTKDFQYFMDRNVFANEKDPLQAHLLNLTGDRWRNLRAKLTPTFTSGKMKMMFNIMVECEADLLKRIDKECVCQDGVNIKEILACFTTNIIGSCAFGLDCQALEDENSAFRKIGKNIITMSRGGFLKRILSSVYPELARLVKFGSSGSLSGKFILNIVKDTVKYRQEKNFERNDFLQMMMKFMETDQFTINDVTAQCLVFFAAGFETSSTLMSFALYELAKNQLIQRRVRDEIQQVLKTYNNQITYESIQEMTYLNQVIDETLRLHPPAGQTNRKCTKDYMIPDTEILIKKGTRITIPILGIHHDPEIYPNPQTFDPDRFTEENKKSRHNYAHLPFGEGPRNCIGMRFGLLQSKVGLVAMLRNYSFTLNEKTQQPMTYEPHGFVLSVKGDVWLNIKRL